MSFLSDLVFEARITAQSLADYVSGNGLRLGVTGLSRAGKTVFITALVQALTSRGGRLPVFRAAAEGRIARGTLQPQPDDAVPRFAVEDHVKALTLERSGRNRRAAFPNCVSPSNTNASRAGATGPRP